jgi:hypothetical protein
VFDDDNFVDLSPINYFQISADCRYTPSGLTKSNYRSACLPSTALLCNEEEFAEVALGWHEEGLEAFVKVKQSVKQVSFPNVTIGDSVELFIDTRDVKTSGFNTKFCHHFFFLPEAFEGHVAGEITKFRTEDMHELCDPLELKVKSEMGWSSYTLAISIPSQCLVGYDPSQFDRLGFTYRINRAGGEPQHFSVTTQDYQIEQQPSLWSSIKLLPK